MYICMYVYAMYGRVLTHREGWEVAGHFLQELDIRIACCIYVCMNVCNENISLYIFLYVCVRKEGREGVVV